MRTITIGRVGIILLNRRPDTAVDILCANQFSRPDRVNYLTTGLQAHFICQKT